MTQYTQEEINRNRNKWLAQLRDPESKKHYGELEDPSDSNARCCLGHACHALGIDRELQGDDDEIFVAYGGCLGNLPNEAARKLDIDIMGCFKNSIEIRCCNSRGRLQVTKCHNLTNVNDSTRLTPKEISDVIREQFEKDNFVPFMCGSDG